MNKIFKKAIACSMAVGTLVAGSAVALNTPVQAATAHSTGSNTNIGVGKSTTTSITTGVSKSNGKVHCSYCKSDAGATSYYTCSGKHAQVKVTGNKQDVTVTITKKGKTTKTRFQVKGSNHFMLSTPKTDKKGTKTWKTYRYIYLYTNGKSSGVLQKITYNATQKKGAKSPTYKQIDINRYNLSKSIGMGLTSGDSYVASYTYNKQTAKSTLSVTTVNGKNTCKCKCTTTAKTFELKDKNAKGTKFLCQKINGKRNNKNYDMGFSYSK